MEIFKVIEPGLLTSVQDLGRNGFMCEGVSEGGAFDKFSLMAVNLCIANEFWLPALEITLTGPILEVLNDTVIAIGGADLEAKVNGKSIEIFTPVQVHQGDIISFGRKKWGCRTYLAVSGGINAEYLFRSYSTDIRIGYGGLRLNKKGIIIKKMDGPNRLKSKIDKDKLLGLLGFANTKIWEIEVIEGPDFDFFDSTSYKSFYENEYEVTAQLDRSGIRLRGQSIIRKQREMLSRPVYCGNIQITTDGQPIILGVESQTIGGYPRIACVISADFSKLAQLFTGDKIRFKKTSIENALTKLHNIYKVLGLSVQHIQ